MCVCIHMYIYIYIYINQQTLNGHITKYLKHYISDFY